MLFGGVECLSIEIVEHLETRKRNQEHGNKETEAHVCVDKFIRSATADGW